jgi:hypothetical protein
MRTISFQGALPVGSDPLGPEPTRDRPPFDGRRFVWGEGWTSDTMRINDGVHCAAGNIGHRRR